MADAHRFTDQYPVRFPDGLRDEIKAAAQAAGRSMNAEILLRLQEPQMTLRDWLAGQALAGATKHEGCQPGPEGMAKRAYALADAMLAAREGRKDG